MFYGVLRGSASAHQVRQLLFEMNIEMEVEILTDSSAARGMVRRSRSGRVKHLEACWLWLQERTRAKQPHVGKVDTALNSADLGTEFHPRLRFAELLMMLPLGIGVGLISSYGAEELSMDRADRENRFVSSTSYLSVRGGSPEVQNSQLACFWEGTASPTHQESRPRIRMQSWSRTQRHSQCQVWFLQEGRS